MKIVVRVLIVLVGLYLLVITGFYVFQEKLLFFPRPVSDLARGFDRDSSIEKIIIRMDGDKTLKGWFPKNGHAEKYKTIIYFGGNGDEASYIVSIADKFKTRSLLAVNYPGYGESDGKPGEEAFFKAALGVYDYAVSRPDIDPDDIVVMGRSIGTGVAVYLASQRKCAGVILVSPYESITAVAQGHYGFLPVGLLLRHKFEAGKYAPDVKVPLLCFYGTQDRVIPAYHSEALISRWAGPKEAHVLKGYGHNDIYESEDLWRWVNGFVSQIKL